MAKITLILGGARSGKSSYAQKLAEDSEKSVTFIATAQAFDEEMATRIKKHQSERPQDWQTLEIQTNIASQMKEIKSEIVVLDCITLLVSNLMMKFVKEDIVDEEPFRKAIQSEIVELLNAIRTTEQHGIMISNEVGLGIVPPYQMGRVYRDELGWANQRLAQDADEVLFMVAGLPMKVK